MIDRVEGEGAGGGASVFVVRVCVDATLSNNRLLAFFVPHFLFGSKGLKMQE